MGSGDAPSTLQFRDIAFVDWVGMATANKRKFLYEFSIEDIRDAHTYLGVMRLPANFLLFFTHDNISLERYRRGGGAT